MPKIVDHDERRDVVAAAALAVIARNGIANSTVQDISQAAGYSTRVVSHYFSSKRNMMLFTLKYAHNLVVSAALAEAETQDDKLMSLATYFLPLDQARRDWWRVWLEFFSMVAADETFAAESRRYNRFGLKLYERFLREDLEAGLYPRGADVQFAAYRVQAAVMGAAAMALQAPDFWSNARLLKVMAAEIKSVRLDLGAPAGAFAKPGSKNAAAKIKKGAA